MVLIFIVTAVNIDIVYLRIGIPYRIAGLSVGQWYRLQNNYFKLTIKNLCLKTLIDHC